MGSEATSKFQSIGLSKSFSPELPSDWDKLIAGRRLNFETIKKRRRELTENEPILSRDEHCCGRLVSRNANRSPGSGSPPQRRIQRHYEVFISERSLH